MQLNSNSTYMFDYMTLSTNPQCHILLVGIKQRWSAVVNLVLVLNTLATWHVTWYFNAWSWSDASWGRCNWDTIMQWDIRWHLLKNLEMYETPFIMLPAGRNTILHSQYSIFINKVSNYFSILLCGFVFVIAKKT